MTPPIVAESSPAFSCLWNAVGGQFNKEGIPTAFFIYKREHISHLSFIRRWLVRWVHFHCHWTSEYSQHSCGFFLNKEKANEAAQAAHNESGEMYCVKELPVDSILPSDACNFGYQNFFASDINPRYQHRSLDVVNVEAILTMQRESRKLTEILKPAKL